MRKYLKIFENIWKYCLCYASYYWNVTYHFYQCFILCNILQVRHLINVMIKLKNQFSKLRLSFCLASNLLLMSHWVYSVTSSSSRTIYIDTAGLLLSNGNESKYCTMYCNCKVSKTNYRNKLLSLSFLMNELVLFSATQATQTETPVYLWMFWNLQTKILHQSRKIWNLSLNP